MLEELPHDLMSRLGYRIAYGQVPRLAEMARFDHGWGRDFAAQVGDEAETIEREVLRRVSHAIHPELIRLAVQDALELRKQRWRETRALPAGEEPGARHRAAHFARKSVGGPATRSCALAVWRRIVRGVDVPGRFLMVDPEFRPVG